MTEIHTFTRYSLGQIIIGLIAGRIIAWFADSALFMAFPQLFNSAYGAVALILIYTLGSALVMALTLATISRTSMSLRITVMLIGVFLLTYSLDMLLINQSLGSPLQSFVVALALQLILSVVLLRRSE